MTLDDLQYEGLVSGPSVSSSESYSRGEQTIESWQSQEDSWVPWHTSIWLCVIHTLNIHWPLVGYVVTFNYVAQQFQKLEERPLRAKFTIQQKRSYQR